MSGLGTFENLMLVAMLGTIYLAVPTALFVILASVSKDPSKGFTVKAHRVLQAIAVAFVALSAPGVLSFAYLTLVPALRY